ncbi:LacI family DNA-binding transcriptional regulator [Anaerobium acetethylicum]|uniref:LacI family transcriptional regulator/LacI family transcriptional regulator, repressor for deo operon, udp, cdd, tsx, nupC, and nupG n=1 Tax=Anaerobium acetethylicum TaxID=1619234 RepID=A0A1D3TW54_9FIRM|nr:LacI family DNA-binding transcriptional regulator [Anaerobium acetethylicum]SCP98443.1 LacI family transcriptional regulator/LacI family transcriptional regulator, repressor for deo operon, udp, cdd, tsx, nupC, and nupG [Anaerobium acetethylicum]
MGITIKELSEISGYSCATISRVITKKGNVKKETKDAIEKLLTEYNYRTNIMELRKLEENNRTIMIIVGDLDNWYYMELIRVIKTAMTEEGYTIIIGFSNNQECEERAYVMMSYQNQYAGIIFINVRGGKELQQLLEQNYLPVIFLNRSIKFASFDTVCSDNHQGGYLATTYLIQMGHRKIGHLMGSTHSLTALERKRGYEDAMRENGLPVTGNSIYFGELDRESGYRCGEDLVKKGLDYTAMFCGNDLMAVGLLEALEDYGVKVPEQLSIVCYDDTPIARKAKVSLTTVSAEPLKMGSMATKVLLSRIAGDATEERTITYKPKLIVRDSVIKIY